MSNAYANFVYYPSEYDNLPENIDDLQYIADNCPPMCYDMKKDLDKCVTYLCDPRCLTDATHFQQLYISGTNYSSDYNHLMVDISQSYTKTLRQTLLQLADNPTTANAKKYEAIMENWIDKSLYTSPTAVLVDNIDYRRTMFELSNCVVAITNSFIQLDDRIINKHKILNWIAKLYDVVMFLKKEYYPDNKGMTACMAKIMCRIILKKPLQDLSSYLSYFLSRTITSDGFILCEERQNMTIQYNYRFLVMFLQAQAYLYQAGAQVITKDYQTLVKKVIDNLAKYTKSPVKSPTIFHKYAQWTYDMSGVSTADIAELNQMYNYIYVNHDITKLVDTKYMASSMTFGDLAKVLKAISTKKLSATYMPSPFYLDPLSSVTIPLTSFSEKVIPNIKVLSQPLSISTVKIDASNITITTTDTPSSNMLLLSSNIYVPVWVNAPLTIKHPNGKEWRYDNNVVRLNAGELLELTKHDSLDIVNNVFGRRGVKSKYGFLNADQVSFEMLVPGDAGFSWDLKSNGVVQSVLPKTPYMAYNPSNDRVYMATASDKNRVNWIIE